MAKPGHPRPGVLPPAATALALALAACATADTAAPPAGLFKAPVGDISGGVAPGPHFVWYAPTRPVSFVRIGVAGWRAPASPRGLRSWLSRLFKRPAPASTEPTAVIASGLGLPIPSRVHITNLATGAMVTVRVDDATPMAGGVIRLSPEAARGLGVAPGAPLMVRVRYVAPVLAYRARPALRYAARPERRSPPPVSPPIAPPAAVFAAQGLDAQGHAAQDHAAQGHAALPVAAEPPRVKTADLRPALPASAAEVARLLRPAKGPAAAARSYRVQAGAFANLGNARRAVDQLQQAGRATIEPLQRGEVTLYRVIVSGAAEPAEAARLRARVAAIGFADARLLEPL